MEAIKNKTIKLTNLCKSYKAYDGSMKSVLNIEELDLEKGKIYAIVGANGCGKSTLLKVLTEILPSDKKGLTLKSLQEDFAYMPQKSYAFKMTTLKNVLLTAKSKGKNGENRDKEKNKEKALDLLKRLKMDNLANQQASKLSGGEAARMSLCRIIMSGSNILLLDEPTAAMDIESTLLAEDLIKAYNGFNESTIILVTHSINQARRLSDYVIFMKDGEICEMGETDKVLGSPKKEETRQFLDFFGNEV